MVISRKQIIDFMCILCRKIILTVLIFLTSDCLAGWFGPSNFDECVLDKMKGNDRSLLYVARNACEKKFPYEKEINLKKEDIQVSWSNEAGYLSIAIEKRSDVYILTRIDAIFYKKEFLEKEYLTINEAEGGTLLKTFTFSPDPGIEGSADEVEGAENYKKMEIKKAWGIMKKQ